MLKCSQPPPVPNSHFLWQAISHPSPAVYRAAADARQKPCCRHPLEWLSRHVVIPGGAGWGRGVTDGAFEEQPSLNDFCIDSWIVASLPEKKKCLVMQTAVRAWDVSLCLGMMAFSLRPSICFHLDKGNPLSCGRWIAFRVKERTETLPEKKIGGVVGDNQMNGLEYLHLFFE